MGLFDPNLLGTIINDDQHSLHIDIPVPLHYRILGKPILDYWPTTCPVPKDSFPITFQIRYESPNGNGQNGETTLMYDIESLQETISNYEGGMPLTVFVMEDGEMKGFSMITIKNTQDVEE